MFYYSFFIPQKWGHWLVGLKGMKNNNSIHDFLEFHTRPRVCSFACQASIWVSYILLQVVIYCRRENSHFFGWPHSINPSTHQDLGNHIISTFSQLSCHQQKWWEPCHLVPIYHNFLSFHVVIHRANNEQSFRPILAQPQVISPKKHGKQRGRKRSFFDPVWKGISCNLRLLLAAWFWFRWELKQ